MKWFMCIALAAFMMTSCPSAFARTIENSDGSLPFVRWVVYRGSAQDIEKAAEIRSQYTEAGVSERPDIYAMYGGIDSAAPGIYRGLEIYRDEQSYEAYAQSRAYQAYTTAIAPLVQKEQELRAEAFHLEAKPQGQDVMVRMARLVIDPKHLDEYKAALREEIVDSVANEPGVKALLATTEAEHPNIFHLLEIYENQDAYERHIAGPYFQKYNKIVQSFVQDKHLILNKEQPLQLSEHPAASKIS